MKRKEKIIAGILLITVSAATLSACGGSKKSGDVKELSLYTVSQDVAYDQNLAIWKKAEELTGIRLINTVSSSVTDENSAFGTMLLSKKLPDIIRSKNRKLRDIAKEGGLIALDEYFDIAPNLKAFFDACPDAMDIASLNDGHIYFVPGTTTDLDKQDTPSTGFFIRKDWLKKLNLEVPTTIEELHNVLYAFKTQDPNGNGIADEVPFFQREKNINGLLNLYCTSKGFIKSEDGKDVVFGGTSDNYREAIKELSKWYKEGLIDNEIYTRNQAREQLLGQNVGGCTADWFSSTGNFNDAYADIVPGIEFSPMLPPKNINSEITWPDTRGTLHGMGWGISKDCNKDDIEATVKYLDFWMSEEGCKLMAYGVEGISYTIDTDGSVIWSDAAISYADGLPGYRRSIGFMETGTVGIMEAEKAGMSETALEGYDMYESIVKNRKLPDLNYTDEEQEIYNKYYNDINTYVGEQQQKWIMGKGDIDSEWDSYVSTLESMGIDKLTKITHDAYTRRLKSIGK